MTRRRRLAALLVTYQHRAERTAAQDEEARDIAAFDAAMREEGPNIPWEQVEADLGWGVGR